MRCVPDVVLLALRPYTGEGGRVELHAWQRSALTDYFRFGGAFLAMGVGAGKTTVAAHIAARCERPAYLAPARGLSQIRAACEAAGAACLFASHTALCRADHDGWFEREQPTDVIVDEAHLLRNISSNTAARRLNRYLVANPRVRVLWMTGTPISRSLRDCVHGLRFALRGRAPLPSSRAGILAFIERFDQSEQAQSEFYAELRQRPGVFIDTAPSYSGRIELSVQTRKPALVLDADSAYWERGPAAWGVRYRIEPRPSDAYRAALRAWNTRVDALISAGACDTEAQARLVRPEAYAEFLAVEDQEPEHEHLAEWEDDGALRDALSGVGPGTLVWAHHRAIQERAASVLGCPREPGGDVAVLSMQRHSTVLDLQRYSTNIILEPQPDAALLDQLIGRTARQGQTAPAVGVRFICAWPGAIRDLRTAIGRARLIANATGTRSPLLQLEL